MLIVGLEKTGCVEELSPVQLNPHELKLMSNIGS